MLKFLLVVCALFQQAFSNINQTGDASMQSCIGEKGEKVTTRSKRTTDNFSKYHGVLITCFLMFRATTAFPGYVD